MTDGLLPAPGTGGGGQDTQSRDTALPVSLAAAAETLRESAHYRQLVASLSGGGTLHMHMVSDGEIAVADLIDGIMDERARGYERAQRDLSDFELGVYDGLGRIVNRLVPLVRAFLPDWNPDTEETP
jgi:hypothetical protein